MSVCASMSECECVCVTELAFSFAHPFTHINTHSMPAASFPCSTHITHHTPRQTARLSSACYLHGHLAVEHPKFRPCSPKLSHAKSENAKNGNDKTEMWRK